MAQVEWEGSEAAYSNPEEQRVLFGALDSFYQYGKVAHFNTTHLRRQAFYALPREHWELLAAPPFNYLDTLNQVDEAIDHNSKLSLAILRAGLVSFEVPDHDKNPKGEPIWRGAATSNDLEKARSTLRQFYRDWSDEGAPERKACYEPVITALLAERHTRSGANMRVLVPGAGLGRLVFDLCSAGFDTEGNEISYHQLLASSYILNHVPRARLHTLHPWIHSFSNHRNRQEHLKSVEIPDLHPATALGTVENTGRMSMSASDFLLLYGDEDQKDTFDAVATMFFLDTAPNILRYIEVIHNCLRPGGIVVNFGPLLWHFENNAPGSHGKNEEGWEGNNGSEGKVTQLRSILEKLLTNAGIADPGAVELTDDEVGALMEEFGFDIEVAEVGLQAPYIQDPASMVQNIYQASFWVARKRWHG